MATVDVHAHFVPPEALRKACADPATYGLRQDGDRLVFEGGPASAQINPLLLDVQQRPSAKVDVQLIGNWMDATGYSLPPDKGAAWSRLFNHELHQKFWLKLAAFVSTGSETRKQGKIYMAEEYTTGQIKIKAEVRDAEGNLVSKLVRPEATLKLPPEFDKAPPQYVLAVREPFSNPAYRLVSTLPEGWIYEATR